MWPSLGTERTGDCPRGSSADGQCEGRDGAQPAQSQPFRRLLPLTSSVAKAEGAPEFLQERPRGAQPSSGQDGGSRAGQRAGWAEGSLHLKPTPHRLVWWSGEPCSPLWRARLQ